LALKGRRFNGVITIQKQSHAILVEFKNRTSANVFNNGANSEPSVSSRNRTTLKMAAWNIG